MLQRGYQSAETKNTLTLLDSYKNYETFETPTTVLRLNKKEAALLRPYFQAELDRAIATYEKKYQFKLTGPVQVEVYPDHEDFAVRTMGMPGLGALGVTFGNVVAMDSPSGASARAVPLGQHHVARIEPRVRARHDQSSRAALVHRRPRGVRRDRQRRIRIGAIAWIPKRSCAIKDKKLLPVADLDRGFVHPTYPAQVIVSYFQGGKICNFIAEKWGYDKLLAMIHDFADRRPRRR